MKKSLTFIFLAGLCALYSAGPSAAQQTERLRYAGVDVEDLYFTLSTEYWTEDFVYYTSDFAPEDLEFDSDFEDLEFEAENYYEWTTSLTILYGLSEHWQVGVTVPLVVRHLERDGNDRLTTLEESETQTALGDISALVNYWDSFAGGEGTLFASLELAFPTDTAGEPFEPGDGGFFASLYADQYWDRFGIHGSLGYNYSLNGDYSTFEYGAGIGVLLTHSLLFSLEPGGEYVLTADWEPDSRNVYRIEAIMEYMMSDRYSLLLSFSSDLSGPDDAKMITLEFSF